MNGFASFVRKETLHIFRDPRTMLIALLMPVVQILLFGFALSTEVNNVDVAVVAPHRSETVRQAVERMAANPNFTFTGYIPSGEIDRMLRSGRADAVAVFADDFDRRMTDLAAGRPVRVRLCSWSWMPRTPIRHRPVPPTCGGCCWTMWLTESA